MYHAHSHGPLAVPKLLTVLATQCSLSHSVWSSERGYDPNNLEAGFTKLGRLSCRSTQCWIKLVWRLGKAGYAGFDKDLCPGPIKRSNCA